MATAQVDSGKGKRKDTGRKNTVGGFYVDKVDGKVMRAYVKKHKLGIDTDVTDEQLAVALVLHFKENVPPAAQVRCDQCLAISSEDEDACPCCGDEGDVEADDDVAHAAAPSAPDLAEVADDADEAEDEDEEDGDDEEDEDAEDEADDDEEDEDEEDTADEPPPAAKETTPEPEVQTPPEKPKKEGAKMSTQTTTTNGAGAKKKSAAIAKTTPADGSKLTARDLDKAIADVQRLKAESVVSYFELGQKIRDINTEQLWKLRKDDEGKQRYKSFDAFVHHELKMSPQHAYNAIDCAKNYGSAEEIRELGGTSKAVLILKAAPEDREKLKEKAKAGATKRELAKDVAKSREKHGSPKKGQQAKAGTKSAAKKTAAAKTEKITVANIEGSRTIKLYKKPESMKGITWPPEKRAKSIDDQPFGRLELQPGVVQYFSVLNKDGEWVLNVQTRREES